MARAFELLCRKRAVGEGWVARSELARLWMGSRARAADSGRTSGAITNGLEELAQQIESRLSWVAPHLAIALRADPPKRATRYRLEVRRLSAPWDFTDERTDGVTRGLRYRFRQGRAVFVDAQVWIGRPNHRLEIDAVREPPDAQWEPPSQANLYLKERETYFDAESARRKAAGQDELHQGELWGIKEVHSEEGREATTVRIVTARISYPDYLLLRACLDRPFTALTKTKTFREWLRLEPEPRDVFCPARDALCVSVALVCSKPRPTVFVAKQKLPRAGECRWELSASGAASSSKVHVIEDKPDLERQVQSVMFRETGVKFDPKAIQWLAFARSNSGGDSSVIALVETDLTPATIEKVFRGRPERDDVEQLLPIGIDQAATWLAGIPTQSRGEFLELGIALVAAKYGFAELL